MDLHAIAPKMTKFDSLRSGSIFEGQNVNRVV